MVVDLRLMEFSWNAQGSASDRSSVLTWDTTSVEANMVHVVLFPLLGQFSQACLSIAAFGRGWARHITTLVTSISVVPLVELTLVDFFEFVRVVLAQKIVVGATLNT